MSDKKYKFKTISERILTSGSALGGVALFGVGLAAVFSPVALAVAGTYAAYKTVITGFSFSPKFMNKSLKKYLEKGKITKPSETASIHKTLESLSRDLGQEKPEVYLIDTNFVAKMALPFGTRWFGKTEFGKNLLKESVMPKVFAALPGSNTILTTEEALAKNFPEEQVRFIMAHEMSHLKTDAFSPVKFATSMVKGMRFPLVLGTTVAVGLSLFGVAVPFLTVGGAVSPLMALGAVVGLKLAASSVINFGSRVKERRADRNALYMTRDLEGGIGAMQMLHGKINQKPSLLGKSFSLAIAPFLTHPGHKSRIKSLTKSFNKVSKFPTLAAPTNDNAKKALSQKKVL